MDQIKTDFLYTLNILFEEGLETRIHAKCNLLLNQQAVGSLSPLLRRKQEEHLEATDALEHGVKFVRIMPHPPGSGTRTWSGPGVLHPGEAPVGG
jgi:conjugal transfer ATP-binding protein TraC